jgi:hypothetical protein
MNEENWEYSAIATNPDFDERWSYTDWVDSSGLVYVLRVSKFMGDFCPIPL